MDFLEALNAIWRSTGLVGFMQDGGIKSIIMIAICLVLLYLAIAKNFEPLLLIPIGFGGILANVPFANIAARTTYIIADNQVITEYGGLLGQFFDIGLASGMFPIDTETRDYDASLLNIFDRHIAYLDLPWAVRDILPEILPAGKQAGILTEAGAKLLDPSGTLKPGIPLCPPEGDAGTGMAATNSVRQRTGNVSAGTSVFAMLVLEKNLSRLHHEIDLVATPDGKPVAMAHSNNCTSDYDAWVALFAQAAEVLGSKPSIDEVYNRLLKLALEADADTGGLFHCSYVSGEHVTGFSEGRPLFVRQPGSSFTLENFMRSLLFTSLCALRTGLNILYEEGVTADEIRGHGGFFKTPEVGQRIMAAATGIPVSLLETAGEGGSWGMALLAAYMNRKDPSITLPDFLDPIFSAGMGTPAAPDPKDIEGFNAYFERYHKGLPIERAAVESLRG